MIYIQEPEIYIWKIQRWPLENLTVCTGTPDINEKIKQYKSRGLQAVMFTFDFHPGIHLFRQASGVDFYREERIKWAEKMGIDILIEFPFTKETSGMEAEDFVRDILVRDIGAKMIVAGSDFHFGHETPGKCGDASESRKESRI